MTAYVVLSCDRTSRESMCAQQVSVFGAATIDEARRTAATAGWHQSGAGDRCPSCSGHPRAPGPSILQVARRPANIPAGSPQGTPGRPARRNG